MASALAALTSTQRRRVVSNTWFNPRTQIPEWMQSFGSKRTMISSLRYSCMRPPLLVDQALVLGMASHVGRHEGAERHDGEPLAARIFQPRMRQLVGDAHMAHRDRDLGVREDDPAGILSVFEHRAVVTDLGGELAGLRIVGNDDVVGVHGSTVSVTIKASPGPAGSQCRSRITTWMSSPPRSSPVIRRASVFAPRSPPPRPCTGSPWRTGTAKPPLWCSDLIDLSTCGGSPPRSKTTCAVTRPSRRGSSSTAERTPTGHWFFTR